MKNLVLIHGRSQQGKDSIALKAEWLASLDGGLSKSGLRMPLAEEQIRFPYYGDTLIAMVEGKPPEQIADVIIRGEKSDASERAFIESTVREILDAAGVGDQQVRSELAPEVIKRGPLNWEWLQSGLKVIDRHVPFGSGASVALFTRDVYRYLTNEAIERRLHKGILEAIEPGVPTVVVAHSLGTVVAYKLLHEKGAELGWKIPLFITVGSPLAIKTIRKRLEPIGHPPCVGEWRNAMDERDVVALYPLDSKSFGIDPAIRNKTDVQNHTENRHGIAGYLDDPEVARWIHDAVA